MGLLAAATRPKCGDILEPRGTNQPQRCGWGLCVTARGRVTSPEDPARRLEWTIRSEAPAAAHAVRPRGTLTD